MTIWQKIKMITKLMFSEISGVVWGAVKVYAKAYGPKLAKAAAKAVVLAAQALADKNGFEKREFAFKEIATQLKEDGFTVGINVASNEVYKAIEDAYDDFVVKVKPIVE